MKRSQDDTVHRVRAVRSWLEEAEASFDKEADIKGELNLMLAEAEMKNLRRHRPLHKGLLRAAAVVAAVALAAGGWYLFPRPAQDVLPPPAPAAVQEERPEAGNESSTVKEAEVPAALPVEEAPSSPSEAQTAAAAAEVPAQPASAAAAPEAVGTPAAPAVREKQSVMSDRQVQAAVQDARHTLRGTGITK